MVVGNVVASSSVLVVVIVCGVVASALFFDTGVTSVEGKSTTPVGEIRLVMALSFPSFSRDAVGSVSNLGLMYSSSNASVRFRRGISCCSGTPKLPWGDRSPWRQPAVTSDALCDIPCNEFGDRDRNNVGSSSSADDDDDVSNLSDGNSANSDDVDLSKLDETPVVKH